MLWTKVIVTMFYKKLC